VVDSTGKTIDFLLSKNLDDGSSANRTILQELNAGPQTSIAKIPKQHR